MKKKLFVLATLALLLTKTQTTFAECCPMDNWYTEFAAGGSWHNNSTLGDGAKIEQDTGFELNFSFGLKTDCCWRLALQGHYERYENDDYRPVDLPSIGDNGNLSVFAFLFNVFYDLPINDCLAWYLGAGAGVGIYRLELNNSFTNRTSHSSTEFAWQLMSGFVYDINPCWAITLNYSWINLLKPEAPTTHLTESKTLRSTPFSNNVDLGFRLKF